MWCDKITQEGRELFTRNLLEKMEGVEVKIF